MAKDGFKKADVFYDAYARKTANVPDQLSTHYCPGCGHGNVHKFIAEAIDDFGLCDRTVFVSAHRLGTVKHCACIYVIDKGRIVEHGTHADLYATAGVYRRLCDSQFAPEP